MDSNHKKILIMDDDAQIREIAVSVLGMLGYEAYAAKDGADALELYTQAIKANHSFDAVILDLTIPEGMGGKETLIELQKIDPNVKAIISSGNSNDDIMLEYKKHGFRAVIDKPYRMKEISQLLKHVLEQE